jgi:hypothetical protein
MARIDGRPTFQFAAPLWDAPGDAAWVFLTVPSDDSAEIRDLAPPRRGFGSVRVRVRLGETTWSTSVFPDSKLGSYVLPVKRPVREAEDVSVGDTVSIELELLEE